MPRLLASLLSFLFVLGIAGVLSHPVLTASNELILRPERFEGLVGEVSQPAELQATLDEGETDGVTWSLRVSERSDMSCLSFSTELSVGDAGVMCTQPEGEEVGPSQFIPASGSWRRSVFIAVLPATIEELRLSASDDTPTDGNLYALPSNFRQPATVLLAFLPAGTDIVAASATTTTGDPLDVSRLADQVDAY